MQRTRTIDLATVAAPSNYIGQRAVWTDFEGRQHVGVLAADPFGGPWPVVAFEDGTYGRNGSVVDLVDETAPAPGDTVCLTAWRAGGIADLPYLCTLDRGHDGPHAQQSSQAGLATMRGAL